MTIDKRKIIEDYSDSDIQVIDDDVEKIQTRLNMYIGYDKTDGHMHVVKEAVQNSIDEEMECIELGWKGLEIFIMYDETTQEFVVSDNGRGIPPNKIISIFTTIQSSGKFDNSNYKGAIAGENGVGSTAINAVSKELTITSTRLGIVKEIKFENGKLVSDVDSKIKDTNVSGTVIKFRPNPEILGESRLKIADIAEWIRLIHYTCKGIKITVHGTTLKGKDFHKIYKSDEGMLDYYKDDKTAFGKLIFDPIRIEASGTVVSSSRKSDKRATENLDYSLDMIFGFKTAPEESINSFCNFVNTIKGGYHVIGVRTGIANAILDCVKKNLSKKDLTKLNPVTDDVRSGLYLALNVFTKIPEFVGQNKEEMNNAALRKPLTEVVESKIKEILDKDKKTRELIIKFVKKNAELRLKDKQARDSSLKEINSNSEWDMPVKLKPVSDKKGLFKGKYELFIGEGDSATGELEAARDYRFQAIYPIKGVPPNTYGISLHKIINAKGGVFKELMSILSCGIGATYDIKKLMYDKIIIATDADPDGDNIASLLCVFFLTVYPEIIEQGKLYRVFTPLYKATYKGKDVYIKDKGEMASLIYKNMKSSEDDIKLKGISLKPKEIQDLIFRNLDYLYYLERLSKSEYVEEDLLEFILNLYICKNMKFNKIKEKLEKSYPFMNMNQINDSWVIEGSHGGSYNYLVLNKEFEINIKEMKVQLMDINNGEIEYKLNGENVYLSNLLRYVEKFTPTIKSRFKGLGQLTSDDLRKTLMQGDRKIVQLTMEDAKDTLEKFDMLHGDNIAARKRMMEKYIISRTDIDS